MKKLKEIQTEQKKGENMTSSQKIKMALAYKNMSEAELARSFGITPQAFSQRLKRDKFSSKDMERIADILNAKWVTAFKFPDGAKV